MKSVDQYYQSFKKVCFYNNYFKKDFLKLGCTKQDKPLLSGPPPDFPLLLLLPYIKCIFPSTSQSLLILRKVEKLSCNGSNDRFLTLYFMVDLLFYTICLHMWLITIMMIVCMEFLLLRKKKLQNSPFRKLLEISSKSFPICINSFLLFFAKRPPPSQLFCYF